MEFTMPIINAITDLGRLGGAAASHRFFCDDQNDYVVKFVETQNKIAINEFVAGSIALKLGLHTPKRVLVNISQEVIDDSSELATRVLPNIPHIGSEGLPKESEDFTKFHIDRLAGLKLTNMQSLYGIVVFDNWVINNDRNNPGNNMIVFLPRNKIHLVMIDFSHCFTNSHWTGEILKQQIGKKDKVPIFPFIEQRLTESAGFVEWVEKVEAISNEYIQSILDAIPSQWPFSAQDKGILFEFLKTRRDMIRKIIISGGT